MSRVKTEKNRSTAWSVVSIAITLLLVVLLVYILSVRIRGGIPSIAGYTILRISSGSMEDTIPTGMYILVHKTTADKIEEGDIITFYSTDPSISGYLNTHRVKEIQTDENGERIFVTKGDANVAADKYTVDAEHLYGKYVISLKVLTVIGNFFMTKAVLLLMFLGYALVAAFAIVGCIQVFKKKDTEETDPEEEKKDAVPSPEDKPDDTDHKSE